MSCGQKCSKKGIKIDKSILRIEIFQNFLFLLFISAQITPISKLSRTVPLILTDVCDGLQADKKKNRTLLFWNKNSLFYPICLKFGLRKLWLPE